MNIRQEREAIGEAHGKLILVGEHIVVYNKPAIAIPCPLKIRAHIKEHKGDIKFISHLYTGNIMDMPEHMAGLYECIKLSLELCNQPKEGILIEMESEIPEGTGMGSSAAAATAIVRGIFRFFEKQLSEKELFSIVELAETYAHGRPSGIDMMTVASEVPLLFHKSVEISPIVTSSTFYMVVADTGKVGVTKKAVTHVKALRIKKMDMVNQIIDEIETIVRKAKSAILDGDALSLGNLLTLNHVKLQALEVSDPLLDHLVDVANDKGALGAKMTGGGMGGCMIALAKNMEEARIIAEELQVAGAKAVWYFHTGSNEIHHIS